MPNVLNLCLHTIHLAIDGTFVETHYILRESPSLVTEDVFHLIIMIHIIENKLPIDEAHNIYSKYKSVCIFSGKHEKCFGTRVKICQEKCPQQNVLC